MYTTVYIGTYIKKVSRYTQRPQFKCNYKSGNMSEMNRRHIFTVTAATSKSFGAGDKTTPVQYHPCFANTLYELSGCTKSKNVFSLS